MNISQTQQRTTGGCLCGAVRYEAEGAPICVAHCHCETCRGHTGAPIVTFVAFDAGKVRFTNENRSLYQSSANVQRGFCGRCGTPLSWEGPYAGGSIIEFYISTTDYPDTYVPEWHWHHEERIAWFDSMDNLPRFRASNIGAEPYCNSPQTELPGS